VGEKENMDHILDTPMRENDAHAATVRGYLRSLLLKLWDEQESFDGKRPFGNSSWEYDLYAALVQAGHVKGTIDADGDITSLEADQRELADRLIYHAILWLR
jgi:hypothetical protein